MAFLVAFEDGEDLAKVKLDHVDARSVVEIARELRERTERLRSGGDDAFERSRSLIRILPGWLLRPVVWLSGWLTASVGVDGEAVVRPQITLSATLDHRFVDGYQAAVVADHVRRAFAEPWALDGATRPSPTVAATRTTRRQRG